MTTYLVEIHTKVWGWGGWVGGDIYIRLRCAAMFCIVVFFIFM